METNMSNYPIKKDEKEDSIFALFAQTPQVELVEFNNDTAWGCPCSECASQDSI
jgi:hypothetical protein